LRIQSGRKRTGYFSHKEEVLKYRMLLGLLDTTYGKNKAKQYINKLVNKKSF
jgi:hypothetical protein